MNKYLRYLGYLITILVIVLGIIIVYKKYELPHQVEPKESKVEEPSQGSE